ncbi:MAG: protein kinase [Steroidobacteraceae bacterium]
MTLLETGIRIGGRFQLLERIGDGGHAEIWAAWDEVQQQRMALKFLHPHLCNAGEALLVLRHEAQMARRLAHPGVLRTEDPQQDGNRIFLPMEHATGGDLKRLRGTSYLESVPVLIRVATILAHAHALGIVHRDIKPGNVLFDAEGNVRLADFGTSALCGSDQTLAAGSPFSASPQQLAGEPASPLDDIYGLGALAYELLSGYPPYYPDFDPVRVQQQMPPPVRPALPAPPRLTQLVMAMLARDPRERPQSMEAVIDVLGEALADTLSVESTGTAMIIESVPVPQEMLLDAVEAPARRRWRPALAVIALLAVAAAGYIALRNGVFDSSQPQRGQDTAAPDAVPDASSPAQSPAPAPDSAAAPDAQTVPADAAPPAAAAPEAVPAVADSASGARTSAQSDAGDDAQARARALALEAAAREFDREIEAGQLALSRGQPALARTAFQRAGRIRPDAVEVTLGLDAAGRLDRVLQLHTQGVQAEAAGQLPLARERFAAALALDGRFAPAIEGRDRVAARLAADERAAAQRASVVERSAQNARDQRTGAELEAAERWRDAQVLYQTAYGRDPAATFAREGVERARQRADFAMQLDDFINRPARLSDRNVRLAAEQALAAGRALQPAGPKLTQQLSQLASLLAAQTVAARVEITSDNSTEVRIARVGELGRFMTRELDLPPGSYTVTGTRAGYRDVRFELTIRPGQSSAKLVVECTERI